MKIDKNQYLKRRESKIFVKQKRTRWNSGSFRSDDVFSALKSEKIPKYNTSNFKEFQYLNLKAC